MTNMITPTEVKAITLPLLTFDVAKFGPHIEPAELEFIAPFCGKKLYAEIKTQYQTGDLGALTDLNKALVVYFKKALAWFVLEKSLPFLQININSTGIQVNNSEYSSSGTDKQRSDLSTVCRQNGQTMLKQAKDYIEDPVTILSYPLYSVGANIDNNTKIIGGIVLGDGDDCDYTTDDFYRRLYNY